MSGVSNGSASSSVSESSEDDGSSATILPSTLRRRLITISTVGAVFRYICVVDGCPVCFCEQTLCTTEVFVDGPRLISSSVSISWCRSPVSFNATTRAVVRGNPPACCNSRARSFQASISNVSRPMYCAYGFRDQAVLSLTAFRSTS